MGMPARPTTGVTRRFVVVALFEPVAVGQDVDRRNWPAHLTLVSNFVATAAFDEVVAAVREVVEPAAPLVMEFGESALFGAHHDVPVRLAISAGAVELHHRLVAAIELLPGYTPDERAHWREGYRPHVTLKRGITAPQGETRAARQIAVAHLDGHLAKVLGTLTLPTADATTPSERPMPAGRSSGRMSTWPPAPST